MKTTSYFLLKMVIGIVFFFYNTTITNAQNFSQPVADLADPQITYIDGYYYYTGTTGYNISLKRARTLEGLKHTPPVVLFNSSSAGAQSGAYWAPELYKLDGKWYMYYTAASIPGSEKYQRTYVLENTSSDPMNPNNWHFKSKLYIPGKDYWAIDGTVLEIWGNRYFLWSGVDKTTHDKNATKPQKIYIARMSSPWQLTGDRVMLTTPSYKFGGLTGNVTEAPEVLYHNGKIFMVYSANGCWTKEYQLRMLYMDVNANPMSTTSWVTHPSPVLTYNNDTQGYGPGHHCFFKSPDGSEDWIAYHATPKNTEPACDDTRTTRVQKLYYNDNGLPVFGAVNAMGKLYKAPVGEPALNSHNLLDNGVYNITPYGTNRLVEIASASVFKGAKVMHWDNNGGLHQRWILQATPSLNEYTIISAHSGLAMEVPASSVSNDANIAVWAPNGHSCQLWTIEHLGSGYYKIINKNSGKVLERKSTGVDIVQNTWNGSNNQKFKIEHAPYDTSVLTSGVYKIRSKKSGKVMDLAGCNEENRANIHLWDDLNNDCQKWNVENIGNGKYEIKSIKSNKNLDVPYCSASPGNSIWQMEDYNNDCQRFIIEHVHDGYYKIISSASNQAVEVSGCSSQSGANIIQWPYWGGDCQLWKFESVLLKAGKQNKEIANADITIYPNPSNAQITISGLQQQNNIIQIFDAQNRLIIQVNPTNSTHQLDISKLFSGIYIVTAKNTEGQKQSKKLIIK